MNKLIFLLLLLPAIANAETKVTGNEISTTTAITVASLTISSASVLPNGFTYLPGGLLFQWGNVSIAANTTSTFSFPKTFATSCFSLTATHGPQGAWQLYTSSVLGPGGVNILSTSQFSLSNLDDYTVTYYWMAIGK